MLQQIGNVPGLDPGAARRLSEVLGKARLLRQEEEDNETVKVGFQVMLLGFVCRVLDLAGVGLIGDLNGDAKVAITEVGCGVIRLPEIEVRQIPAEESIEKAGSDRF
ncbi:MAG TPA: hypothetical protein VGM05_06320 [Planctomycetaceae bacterium]